MLYKRGINDVAFILYIMNSLSLEFYAQLTRNNLYQSALITF